jgi:hypothetical protein
MRWLWVSRWTNGEALPPMPSDAVMVNVRLAGYQGYRLDQHEPRLRNVA